MTEVAERTELHRMTIANPAKPVRYEWNGEPEERAEARAAFEEAMTTGLFLAYKTVEAPAEGKPSHEQIREFDPEASEITLAPRLVGG